MVTLIFNLGNELGSSSLYIEAGGTNVHLLSVKTICLHKDNTAVSGKHVNEYHDNTNQHSYHRGSINHKAISLNIHSHVFVLNGRVSLTRNNNNFTTKDVSVVTALMLNKSLETIQEGTQLSIIQF